MRICFKTLYTNTSSIKTCAGSLTLPKMNLNGTAVHEHVPIDKDKTPYIASESAILSENMTVISKLDMNNPESPILTYFTCVCMCNRQQVRE